MKSWPLNICLLTALVLLVGLGCETKSQLPINSSLLKSIDPNYQEVDPAAEQKPIKIEIDNGSDEGNPKRTYEVVDQPEDNNEADVPPGPYYPNGPDPYPPEPGIFGDYGDGYYGDGYYDGPEPGLYVVGICGDGKRSITEQCDDGNADNKDGCNVLCKFPACGNGVIELGEGCDDNNLDDGDGCNKRCQYEKCGNGFKDDGESCDDGNITNGDGCSQYCQYEVCGNNVITPNEKCDDGNTISGDGCSADCMMLD